ncbi:uncharacterized protein N7482_000522 [Penicillium canariense]|uniref:Uncharacterized protein n=1 Tax=Penicillium canariense TaxID=189055 RepID=A0A9W9IC42_9EURO|nr:uncharacterized protein N7482_000522 [Penicillium canariense]KAJ5174645.1 hypothetical protein N7482_000522 [Penicillium canariense]
MASTAASYKIDFYDYDGPPDTGCENEQLLWRGKWNGDVNTRCTTLEPTDNVKYIRITKDHESDDHHNVLLSSFGDCGEVNAIRVGEGCFDISGTLPGLKSYQVVPRDIEQEAEKTVDSWWAPDGDTSTPILVWTITTIGVTVVNTIRSRYGELIAAKFAVIGRPLWAFVSSHFISLILTAQVFASGTVYWKRQMGNREPCKRTEPKIDILKTVTEIAPLGEVESIQAIATLKDGRTMTINHQVMKDEAK